jgi:hypothetical protein
VLNGAKRPSVVDAAHIEKVLRAKVKDWRWWRRHRSPVNCS